MKILFLADDFPPKSFGGAGIITYYLALGIKKLGHQLFVITTTQKKEDEGWSELNGLKVFNLYTDYYQKLSTYISLYNKQSIDKLDPLIKEIKPDIIHAHNIHNYLSYYSLKIAKKYTDKLFITTHDAMAFNYGKLINYFDKNDLTVQKKFDYKVSFWDNLKTAKKRYNPIRNIFIRIFLNKYPNKIFAISNVLKEALTQNGFKKVQTIHYGIDIEDFKCTSDEKNDFINKYDLSQKKIILFGGRLSEPKGGKVMIDTLNELVKEDKNIILLIAGVPNDYSKYLLKYADNLAIKKNIIFTGWLDRDDMRKAYSVSDVVITPSIYFDAFNLFNIEAGASSKPVIGTCFGGTPEIVLDGVTGIIVNPLNINMMKDSILSILNNKNLALKMGEMGHKRVLEYFNLERYARQTIESYSS